MECLPTAHCFWIGQHPNDGVISLHANESDGSKIISARAIFLVNHDLSLLDERHSFSGFYEISRIACVGRYRTSLRPPKRRPAAWLPTSLTKRWLTEKAHRRINRGGTSTDGICMRCGMRIFRCSRPHYGIKWDFQAGGNLLPGTAVV